MKRLYRSRTTRILGGVCGGLSAYFDIDPNIIRLIWVALTIISVGTGIIVYIIAWILIPEEPEVQEAAVPGS
ncbi:MAG: PspC domain-containing protein [Methanomicrobiales archaeon]|nr:PspC domain-containing protein [Methanomicrobiales archaeon]